MKVSAKKTFIWLLFLLMILLPACAHSDETISQKQIPIMDVNETQSEFVITLLNGQTKAVVNGTDAELSSAPFIRDGSFYYPIADIVKLVGGDFSQVDDTATVQISGVTVAYTAGNPDVIVDGIPFHNDYRLLRFSKASDEDTADNTVAPVFIDNTLYVPHDLCPGGCPIFGLNIVQEVPEADMLILGGYTDEWGTQEIHLYDFFDQLPDDTKNLFQSEGITGSVLNYSIETYISQGTEVYVMRCFNGQEDVEDMDGKVAAIRLLANTLDQTPRGLTVGDSAYRAWLLYGNTGAVNSFYYQVQDGFVKSIVFYTRYFGGAL